MIYEWNYDFWKYIFQFIDEIKDIIQGHKWKSVALDCSKNELLALFFIYRKEKVNNSDIAEYIGAPLNTVTGVINRLEKKGLVERLRDKEDKRVVNIILTDMGKFKVSEVCDIAQKFYYLLKEQGRKIEEKELLKICYKYLSEHNTCALATGTNGFVRCTPLEYLLKGKDFYLITEGGMKFYGMLQNKNVCVSVFESYKGMGKLKGMQLTGIAENVEYLSDEYNNVIKLKGLKAEVLKKLPVKLNVIKVKISRIEYLNSDFKKKCYNISQILELSV